MCFIVREEPNQAVTDLKAISGKICKLRIREIYRKISIINVHAPTEMKVEEEKDKFYEELSKVIQGIPRYDIKISVGDINAKIERESIYKNITEHSKHKESKEN